MKALYLRPRFFQILIVVCLTFGMGLTGDAFFAMGKLLLLSFLAFLIFDLLIIMRKSEGIRADRKMAERFSNGDNNPISVHVENSYDFPIDVRIIDELPIIFQRRDVHWELSIGKGGSEKVVYQLRPVKRGGYKFGALNIFARSKIGLVEKRYRFGIDKEVKVYPSYIQLRKYGFTAIHQRLKDFGPRKQRRLGHTMEFEQIKDYVTGDDPRNINWKATARRNELMVNQFQEERSQHIYNVIDKGRLMRMPFGGLSLLDYAINSALVLSHVAIYKHDKTGLLTFERKMSGFVMASKRNGQMERIVDMLYNQRTKYLDASFERLGIFISRRLNQRSLLLLYTNFETLDGLNRQLPYIKNLARKHVLVVIFFKNTGIQKMVSEKPGDLRDIYRQTIGEKLVHEKNLIVRRLRQVGAYALLTRPEDLTVNTINKYLELKNKGVI